MKNMSAKFVGKLGLAAMALAFSGCDKDKPENGGTVDPKPTERTTIPAIQSDIDVIKLNTDAKTLTIYGGYGDNSYYTVYSYDTLNAAITGPKVKMAFENADLASLTPTDGGYVGKFANKDNLSVKIKSATSDMVAYSKDGKKQTPEIYNTKALYSPLYMGDASKEVMMSTWQAIKDNKSTITFTEVTNSNAFRLKYQGTDFSLKAPQ